MTVQITAYLPSDDAETFLSYSNSVGIDKSSLANLLIVRELRLDRLGSLSRFRHGQPSASCIKVTAHLSDSAIKDAFTASAARHKLRPGTAASIIFRAELEERWLEQSLSQHVTSSKSRCCSDRGS